jgi:OmpA-OmpF porin, OOP family
MFKPNFLRSLIIAAAAAPAIAMAQGVELYLGVPFNKYDDKTVGGAGLEDSIGTSLSAGYRFDNPFGVELTYSRADSGVKNQRGFDADQSAISLDGLYHFAETESLSPYVSLGASDYRFDYSNNGADSEDYQTAVNLGLGVKKHVTENFVVRAEGKLFHTLDYDQDHSALAVSFGYAFGSKPAPAPVAAPAPVPVAPKDSDNDGVTDDLDKCPDTAAKLKVDADGCPIILKETVSISLNVLFDTASDLVKPEFDSEVKKVADFLEQYQGTSVVIEGHTDTRGSNTYNKTLSQKRANAVAKVLVEKFGIAASRVQAVGYGEEQPLVAKDKAPEDQAKNRRVIAKLSAEKQTEVTK